MNHDIPQRAFARSANRAQVLVPLTAVCLVLSACSDRSVPTSVSDADLSLSNSTSESPCPLAMAFVSGDLKGSTFTVDPLDYNQPDLRWHDSPYSCETVFRSTLVSSSGPDRVAYHVYPFSSLQVYTRSGGSETIQFDCDGCFDMAVYFNSRAPDPGYVGGGYVVRARFGYNDEHGVDAGLQADTPHVCTLDGGMSPATAAFHATGTCTIRAEGGWDSPPTLQSFQVVLPFVADAEVGVDVVVIATNPDDPEEPAPATLTFDEVTSSGTVTVTTEIVSDDSDVDPPANFSLGDPPTYYNITLSEDLVFDGMVRVCITYAEGEFGGTTPLLLHWNGSEWDELPGQEHDPTTRTVCAYTDSFSPFAVAAEITIVDEKGDGKAKAKAKGRD
jgi:hypothetical protein